MKKDIDFILNKRENIINKIIKVFYSRTIFFIKTLNVQKTKNRSTSPSLD